MQRKIKTVVTEMENRCKSVKPVRKLDLTSIYQYFWKTN